MIAALVRLIAVKLVLASPLALASQATLVRLAVDVRDAAGAPVPGAIVTLEATPNRRATTAADGRATITGLRPGRYALTVDAGPLGRARRDHDEAVAVGASDAAITIVLSPARLPGPGESVDVRGSAGAAPGVSSMSGDRLARQPSLDRDPVALAAELPGMAPPAPGSRLSTQGNTALNSTGAREASNSFLIDGLDNNDRFINRLTVTPSLDAIDTLVVRQNAFDASIGRSAGATLDITLKSGTNEFRGNAYAFAHSSPRQIYGATAGGPLVTSGGAFFFAAAEGLTGAEPQPRAAHVPTLAERAGDFSGSGVTIRDPFTGQPFPANRIPASRLSPAGLAILQQFPEPNRADATTNFFASPDATRDVVTSTVKVDARTTGGSLLSVRYSFSSDTRDLPYVARNRNLPGFGLHILDRGHSIGAAWSGSWSARMANTLRGGLTWSARDNLPGSAPASITYLVAGFETLGDDPNLPVTRRTRGAHVADTLSIDLGRHVVTTGADWRRYASDGRNELFSRGRLSFSGAYTGSGLADLLLGFPSFGLHAINDNRQALRTWSAAAFVQDDWHVTARVTVSGGLRYEYFEPPYDADDRMRIFDAQRLALVDVGRNGVSRSGLDRDLNNVAPRLAASWDATGAGRTVLRGGYGVFYDAGTLIENSALYFNPPYYDLRLYFPTATSPIDLADPFPSGAGVAPLPSINTIDRGLRTAYSHQWTAGLDQRWRGATMSARYVGALGRNLVRKRNVNQPEPGPGALDPRRPIAGFGDILVVESQAHSTYHALALAIDRPWRNGFEAHVAYTLSRSMDDASAFLASDGNDNTPQDGRHPEAEWGPSDFDVRHRLVASATWLTASTLSWWQRDWQASVLVTAQSGRPYTPRLSYDNSNTGNAGGATFASDRPNVVNGAFVVPPPFTFGNAGRNSLRGPALATVDGLISRRIPAGGRRVVEFRLEGFNLFDRRNGQLPDSFVDHQTFRQVLAYLPGRQWQFAAKLNW